MNVDAQARLETQLAPASVSNIQYSYPCCLILYTKSTNPRS